jgi:hypothetical protein
MPQSIVGWLALPLLGLLAAALVGALYVWGRMRGEPSRARVLLVALGAVLLMAPVYAVQRNYQGTQACLESLRNLAAALELYAQSNGGEYPPDPGLLVPGYFDELPDCPVAAVRDPGAESPYVQSYESAPGNVTTFCQGHFHGGLGGAPPDHPFYSARKGLVREP